jgi:hypothetical protein
MRIGDAGCGGLGRVLAGLGLGVGALWAGVGELTPVGIVQRGRGRGEGGSGRFLPFPSISHGLGRGRGGWGSTEGESTSMATGLGRMGTASATVASIFLDFAHQVFDQMPARIQNSNF